MPFPTRPRRPFLAALAAAAVLAVPLLLAACDVKSHPNSTFLPHTEFGRRHRRSLELAASPRHRRLHLRRRPAGLHDHQVPAAPRHPQPKHVHGNTTLEILWTVIPALILVLIAVPTVEDDLQDRSASRQPIALQVEVYGHQWWWEFRYPQYGVTTANELYLPIGRKVNFALRTSGRAPQLLDSAARRKARPDLEPYELPLVHARFVDDGERVERHAATSTAASATRTCGSVSSSCRRRISRTGRRTRPVPRSMSTRSHRHRPRRPHPRRRQPPSAGRLPPPAPDAPPLVRQARMCTARRTRSPRSRRTPDGRQCGIRRPTTCLPARQMPAYTFPRRPTPDGLTFTPGLVGDPARGLKTVLDLRLHRRATRSRAIRCSVGATGPNLTHIGSRYTIAGCDSIPMTPSTCGCGSRTPGR